MSLQPSDPRPQHLLPPPARGSPAEPAPAMAGTWLERVAGTLKLRLLLGGALALAAAIGVSTGALLQRAERDTLGTRQLLEINEAARNARELAFRVQTQQKMLAVAAQHLRALDLTAVDTLEARLRDSPILLNEFDSVFIVDVTGRMLVIHDGKNFRRPDLDLSDRPYVQRALREGVPVISEVIISRVTEQPVLMLVQPLLQEGRTVGLLAAGLRLKSRNMLAGLADSMEGDDDVLVAVTDAHGVFLAHPQPALIGTALSSEPRLMAATARWREAGAPIEPAGLAFDDLMQVVAVAGVTGPDWLVWRLRSKAAILAPLAAGRTEALHWAAICVFGVGVLLALWLQWLLRPLARLNTRAQHLFDPTMDADAGWPGAKGEIGSLEAVLRTVLAERRALELANARSLDQLHSLMSAAPVGIALSCDRRFERVSQALCRMLGCSEAALLGQPTQTMFASNDDHRRLMLQLAGQFGRGEPHVGEWELLRADGTRFPARLRAQPVNWSDPAPGTIWTFSDVTEEVAARSALEWAATHDPLTGLANRSALTARLKPMFGPDARSQPAALLLVDLDRFKPINDTHGHAAGDAMLRAVAAAMNSRVRSGDLVVRMGGDEFALLLERCPADVASRVADEVRQAVADIRLPWGDDVLGLACSVGMAVLDSGIASADGWLAVADAACYAAKQSGRGIVRQANRALRLVAHDETLSTR